MQSRFNFGGSSETGSTIKTKLESLTSPNKLSADALQDGTTNKVYTATEQSKLSGIAAGATAETGTTIKTKLEALTGTDKLTADALQDGTTNKVYTATEQSKLSGIAAGATAETGTTIKTKLEALTGTDKLTADALQDGTTNKVYTATEQSKLSGIAAGAKADHGVLTGLADDDHPQYSIISSQAGAPSSTPARIGAINIDTAAPAFYYGKGTSSSSDWASMGASDTLATLETTDATPTDLLSIAAGAATSSSTIEGLIHGLTSDGSIKYCVKFICDYDADGINGSPFGNVIKKGTTSTMDVAFSISSSNLKITVTGIAATTIHWKLSYRTTVKAY